MILGTVQLGMNYGVNNVVGKPDASESRAMLSFAESSGIRILDTAEGYGASEDVIGEYISTRPDSFKVCTKLPVSLTSSGPETVRDGIRGSMARLSVKSIWCCYLHRFEQFLDDKIMLQLEAAKDAGLIEHVGVSIYSPDELQRIVDSRWNVSIVQIPINVLSSASWSSSAEAAKRCGITLFARSVYLQGLVFVDPSSTKASQIGATDYLARLNSLARERHCGIASYCMGFVKSLDYIDDVLIGCETLQQLKENVSLSTSCPSFSAIEVDEVQNGFNEVPQLVINPSLWPKG